MLESFLLTDDCLASPALQSLSMRVSASDSLPHPTLHSLADGVGKEFESNSSSLEHERHQSVYYAWASQDDLGRPLVRSLALSTLHDAQLEMDSASTCTLSGSMESCSSSNSYPSGASTPSLLESESSHSLPDDSCSAASAPISRLSQKRRKSRRPSRAPSPRYRGLPGIVFRVTLPQSQCLVIKEPCQYGSRRRKGSLVPQGLSEPQRPCPQRVPLYGIGSDGVKSVEDMGWTGNPLSYPTSELFYNSFADNPLRPHVFLNEYSDNPFLLPLSQCEDGKRVKKKQGTVRKDKGSSKQQRLGDKVCASCKSTATPIWREVKDTWGENWNDILLCNACGLRKCSLEPCHSRPTGLHILLSVVCIEWRMCGLRCTECDYVPRASEKKVKKCPKCPGGKWHR